MGGRGNQTSLQERAGSFRRIACSFSLAGRQGESAHAQARGEGVRAVGWCCWMCELHSVAVCCSVLQCAAVAVCCSVLQCIAVGCSVLQRVAVCCSGLQWVTVGCSGLQCVAVCCSLRQCVALYCSVWQCDAVCCSLLQCVHFRAMQSECCQKHRISDSESERARVRSPKQKRTRECG